MPVNPASIGNAYKRSDEYRKQKRQKGQEKLKRRLEVKKDEAEGDGGEERKKVRLFLRVVTVPAHQGVRTDHPPPRASLFAAAVAAAGRADWRPMSRGRRTTRASTARRT
jgi:hypothetical protein